jgi:ATP-dependent DNA ligase
LLAERVILDGEIAALDEKGRSSFQLLQLFKKSGDVPLVYDVFDLLSLEGKDLRNQPLTARRKALANVLKDPPDNIRLSDELRGAKTSLSALQKSLAWRDWLSTRAAGAAVPGSNSRSQSLRNL